MIEAYCVFGVLVLLGFCVKLAVEKTKEDKS